MIAESHREFGGVHQRRDGAARTRLTGHAIGVPSEVTGCLRARPAPPEGDEPPSRGCPFGLTDHGAPELCLNAMRELAVWAKKAEHTERALRYSRHLESPRRSGAFSTIEPFDDVHVIVPSPSGDSVTTDLLVSTACSDPPALLTSKTPPALPAER